MIEMRRAQLNFGDGLIAEEVIRNWSYDYGVYS